MRYLPTTSAINREVNELLRKYGYTDADLARLTTLEKVRILNDIRYSEEKQQEDK